LPAVVRHQVADDAAGPPAGKRVVAEVDDALGGQVRAAHLEDLVLHVRRDPTEYAVNDDVIERVGLGADLLDVLSMQVDVFEAGLGDDAAALRDLLGRQIDAEERGPGQGDGQRDEVPAGRATELQHAAGDDRYRPQPGESRHRRQAVRLRLRVRLGEIRDDVVAGRFGRNVHATPRGE